MMRTMISGSKDNISCVVVKLPGLVVGAAELGGVLKRREARESKLGHGDTSGAPVPLDPTFVRTESSDK